MEVTNSQYRVDAAAKRYAAAALLAVAIYNAIEMIPIVYFTFSRFSGLYFWSMVTAVTGVMINAIGFGEEFAAAAIRQFRARWPYTYATICSSGTVPIPGVVDTKADPTALQC